MCGGSDVVVICVDFVTLFFGSNCIVVVETYIVVSVLVLPMFLHCCCCYCCDVVNVVIVVIVVVVIVVIVVVVIVVVIVVIVVIVGIVVIVFVYGHVRGVFCKLLHLRLSLATSTQRSARE